MQEVTNTCVDADKLTKRSKTTKRPQPPLIIPRRARTSAFNSSPHSPLRPSSPIMASADNAPNLLLFLGSPDDECPICLEAMPPLTHQEKERATFLCCGNFMCLDCADKYAIGKCPLCRAELPSTDEEALQCQLKFIEDRTGKQSEEMRGRVAYAQFQVAGRYSRGIGTPQDLVETARWHKAAAE